MNKAKKRIIWIVIILALAVGGYFLLRPKTETVYTTEAAKKGTLAQTVSVTGKINPDDQVDLAFKVSGRLRTLTVGAGDKVKKGQLLGSVEPGVLNAQLREAQEQVKYQKETLNNMKERKGTYNSEQRDAQRAQVRAAEANVSAVLAQFGETRLFSPIDGTVLQRSADPGEIVSLTDAVLSVGNPDNLIIEMNVPESDIVKIKLDQDADVTFDALPADEIFSGKVVEIDPASTEIQDVVYYRVKVKLDKIDGRIKPGMSVSVDVKTAEKGNVIMVPMRAVKTENEKKYVEVLVDEKNNLTEKRWVETGLEGDEGLVEAKSGVKEGEKVVTFTKSQ